MSHRASLDLLLADILGDLEDSLRTAKNGPAKKRLTDRIDRVKLALSQSERETISRVPATPETVQAE